MSDNVIIFGAGASFDAGIPLLASFVDKMWEIAVRGQEAGIKLSDDQRQVFTKANEIRAELEPYNSRAFFDNRNLEDILSLLVFEVLDAKPTRYDTIVKAVALTIELSCKFRHRDATLDIPDEPTTYTKFWNRILSHTFRGNLPAIITFNYDLVFERTLWLAFHFLDHLVSANKPNVDSCLLKYGFGQNDFYIKQVPHTYGIPRGAGMGHAVQGRRPQICDGDSAEAEIQYFKLHGSLNWSKSDFNTRPKNRPTQIVDDPLILPPVFSKMSGGNVDAIWKSALTTLRNAKNIVIVGYSLPRTDIYMQYFLRAAVGPNSNLQRISVYDPILFQDGKKAKKMKERYLECFAPQFANRIIFNPQTTNRSNPKDGTFEHFVENIGSIPKQLFFLR